MTLDDLTKLKKIEPFEPVEKSKLKVCANIENNAEYLDEFLHNSDL